MKRRKVFLKVILCISLMLISSIGAAAAADVAINSTNFPDAVFRTYVKDRFDSDHNSILSYQEICAADSVSLVANEENDYAKITSLKGLEYLTELRNLELAFFDLTSIDVTRNTKLVYLSFSWCGLKELDVSNNLELVYLGCMGEEFQSLNLQNNRKLETLACQCNNLTSLDISNNKNLRFIVCFMNELTELNISNSSALTNLVKGTVRKQVTEEGKGIDDWGKAVDDVFLRTDSNVTVIAGDYISRPLSAGKLNLPKGIKRIEDEAFAGTDCEVVIIPDGCVSIGSKAFANCNHLQRVVIPASVTSIANDAFEGCENVVIDRNAE